MHEPVLTIMSVERTNKAAKAGLLPVVSSASAPPAGFEPVTIAQNQKPSEGLPSSAPHILLCVNE